MGRVRIFALNHTACGQPYAAGIMDTLYIIVFSFGGACGLLLSMTSERVRMPTLLAMGAKWQ